MRNRYNTQEGQKETDTSMFHMRYNHHRYHHTNYYQQLIVISATWAGGLDGPATLLPLT